MSFASLIKNHQSNKDNGFNVGNLLKVGSLIIPVRVTYILLDDSDKTKFEAYGGWNGIGTIEYELIENPITPNIIPIAHPLTSNIKNFPLINEVVYLISLPSTDIGKTNVAKRPYYINIVSLWNHPHHNAYPSKANEPNPPAQKDYIQTQAGSAKIVTNETGQIFLGNTFKEREDIHPLRPFEGDVIYEGRWGNSIRLGSTVQNTPNNWSDVGNNGDPITIIRNGQPSEDSQPKNISGSGWIPITENINNDDSSIYLTSTQQIPLNALSVSYISYPPDSQPTSPSKYSGKQIILNSGRLVFNTNKDHILLSSAKSINLNSQKSVNIDTPTFIIQSNKMYLGSNKATEPLMLGNQTVQLLKNLIDALDNFFTIMQTATTSPVIQGSPATLPTLNQSAIQVKGMLENIKITLNKGNLTSNSNYTI